MGLFQALFGLFGRGGGAGDGPPGRFVSDEAFQEDLTRQPETSVRTLGVLREHGVKEDAQLRLEFFFYTNAEAKADALASALRGLGYDVETDAAAHDARQRVVTGWSKPVAMSEAAIRTWTADMIRVGYDHDCTFDGWGTNVPE